MKNGIGPQNLGAMGMNPKSKPCGTPLDFNSKLEAAVDSGKITGKFADVVKENSPNNSGSPLYFQDDISKIQEAASTLEAHNIGGGGAAQGASAAAQENAAAAPDFKSAVRQTLLSQGGRLHGGLAGLVRRARTRMM
jgi:hypothetical protein